MSWVYDGGRKDALNEGVICKFDEETPFILKFIKFIFEKRPHKAQEQ